ncbi:LysR family transcriptional regulator [Pusillimonas sp. DMV24BSW_D]|uniref:LysR family transcriptional regulator n=1 Tax=Neopusillimonas aestuarii TaxID=2716226 RepID=UPI00140A8812|nr:LysR substrate-binding domain-containing protein [Pusillimonas sp. DMV24BSW_D]QIM48800.1 LysR family transcriptional regulator [Pusillimonas sp. DMV24BSW_D]
MKLDQLRYILKIAEVGSLRKAAALLGVSAPALTKSLRQLEDELQAPLLTRTARGVVLTEFGRIVVTRARTAFTEIDRISEELKSLRGDKGGHVRVAVSPITAVSIIPSAVQRFRRTYPEVVITVMDGLYPKVLPLIRERDIDFAVGPLPEPMLGPEFSVEQLFLSEIGISCRKGHPLEHATSLAELKDAAWATSGPEEGPGNLFKLAFQQRGLVPPKTILHFESILSLLAAALKEDLVFVMPKKIVQHPFHVNDICRIPLQEQFPAVPIYLIKSSQSPLTPVAEAFATQVRRTPLN